jgi:hypothetical protein
MTCGRPGSWLSFVNPDDLRPGSWLRFVNPDDLRSARLVAALG